jgi:hypothetical protein
MSTARFEIRRAITHFGSYEYEEKILRILQGFRTTTLNPASAHRNSDEGGKLFARGGSVDSSCFFHGEIISLQSKKAKFLREYKYLFNFQ